MKEKIIIKKIKVLKRHAPRKERDKMINLHTYVFAKAYCLKINAIFLYINLPTNLRTSSLPKEEDENPFGKMKLKKTETVKRTWDDDKLETVDLKHHEFERPALEEQVDS